MAVIADLPNYPEWTPGISEVELLTVYEDDERPHQARFVLEQMGFHDAHVYTYEWDGNREVRWTLAEPAGIVNSLDGTYELTETEGQTEVTYSLAVEVGIPILGLLRRRAEKIIIDSALRGLKRRVED